MFAVVAASEVLIDLHELEADEAEAAVLQALEDGSGEAALHGVGLDEDEGAFGCHAAIVLADGPARQRGRRVGGAG